MAPGWAVHSCYSEAGCGLTCILEDSSHLHVVVLPRGQVRHSFYYSFVVSFAMQVTGSS